MKLYLAGEIQANCKPLWTALLSVLYRGGTRIENLFSRNARAKVGCRYGNLFSRTISVEGGGHL